MAVNPPSSASADEADHERGARATDANDDDALPAVGKVAEAGATRSLWQAFKKNGDARPTSNLKSQISNLTSAPGTPPDEPPHLVTLRAQATEKLIGRHAAMFGGARLTAYDDATGALTLAFAADDAGQADYVRRNRDAFAAAFAAVTGRDVTIGLDVAAAPEVPEAAAEEARPRVVRPRLDEVAAEVKDEPTRPAVDVDAVKDDPLVAAILRTFAEARIVKVE